MVATPCRDRRSTPWMIIAMTGVSMVVSVTGMIIMPVFATVALGRQKHAAFRAGTLLGATHFGVHRTGIDRARKPLGHGIEFFIIIWCFAELAFGNIHPAFLLGRLSALVRQRVIQ